MEQFLGGLQILTQWQNFLIIPLGLAIGIVVGAIPGLTSDLGIILCIPLTYGMDPTMAILMLLAIYCGGTYGGAALHSRTFGKDKDKGRFDCRSFVARRAWHFPTRERGYNNRPQDALGIL